jgi:uncharacterized protein with HEPN domain
LKKDVTIYLEDMINAIVEIEKSTKEVSFEAFASSYEKMNSVAYDVLILGEAVDKSPKSVQDQILRFHGEYLTTSETNISTNIEQSNPTNSGKWRN